jgi:hypothetical protein
MHADSIAADATFVNEPECTDSLRHEEECLSSSLGPPFGDRTMDSSAGINRIIAAGELVCGRDWRRPRRPDFLASGDTSVK